MIHGAQRPQACADDEARAEAHRECGDVFGVERAIEDHVVDDRDQRFILHLESGRTDADMERIVEGLR